MWKNNLKSSVKPLLILCQIFGLHPERGNFYENTRSNGLRKILLEIYTICLLSGVIVAFFLVTKYTIIDDVNIIVQVADIVVTYSNLLLMVVDILGNYIRRKQIQKALIDLIKIEHVFWKKLDIKVKYRSLRKFLTTQIAIAITIWIFFGIYYTIVACTKRKTYCLLYMIAYYISTKVAHVHVLQLCAYFLTIKIYFQTLNLKLNQVYLQYGEKPKSHRAITYVNERAQLETFMIVRQIYDQLCDTSRSLNSAYSLPLLFTFANAFVVVFCSFYGCLFGYVLDDQVTDRTDIKFLFVPATVLLVTVIKILMMTVICEQLSSESRCTGAIIHKISIATEENAIKETVQDFSLQLMHQSLQISAFGFFNIDCSLLQTIIGAVTTYLVILIQFDLAIPKKDPSAVANITTTAHP